MHTPLQQELLEIQRPQFSPDVTIEPIAVLSGSAYVVRDDLLNGRTEQRAAVPFVTELPSLQNLTGLKLSLLKILQPRIKLGGMSLGSTYVL